MRKGKFYLIQKTQTFESNETGKGSLDERKLLLSTIKTKPDFEVAMKKFDKLKVNASKITKKVELAGARHLIDLTETIGDSYIKNISGQEVYVKCSDNKFSSVKDGDTEVFVNGILYTPKSIELPKDVELPENFKKVKEPSMNVKKLMRATVELIQLLEYVDKRDSRQISRALDLIIEVIKDVDPTIKTIVDEMESRDHSGCGDTCNHRSEIEDIVKEETGVDISRPIMSKKVIEVKGGKITDDDINKIIRSIKEEL